MTAFKSKIRIVLSVVLMLSALGGVAQRRVTPVERSNNRTLTAEEHKRKVKELKSKGLVILGDTIVSDSTAMQCDSLKSKRMQYPKLTSLIFGANIWDPVMRILGQKYGGIDFSAELSLWNRFIPIVEVGAGWADNTPEDMNFTYKGKLSLYGKLGASYNFKFNNSPDYVALLGFRAGYSNFGYEIRNIRLQNGYWNQSQTIDILNQRSHALWGEFALSIRVKIYRNISAGWALKYHFLFNHKTNENSEPWYIPGYGTRTSRISGGLSVFYTLPFSHSKSAHRSSSAGEAIDNAIDKALEKTGGADAQPLNHK